MRKTVAAGLLLLVLSAGLAAAADEEHAPPEINDKYLYDQFVKIINVGLVVGLLIFFLRKPVISFFKNRARQIDEDINAAQRAREEAERRLAEVEEQVSQLQSKVQEIKEKAVSEGEVEKQRIISGAEEEAARIIAAAEREIDNRVKSGSTHLKEYAASLALQRARELLIERMDAATDKELIDRTMAGIGGKQ